MSDKIHLAESQLHLGNACDAGDVVTAKIAQLSENRCAVFFDSSADFTDPKARLTVYVGGAARCTPVMILRLPLVGSRLRVVALLSTDNVPLHLQDVRIHAGTRLVALIDPNALQSPVVDHLSLLSDLSHESQTKLLRALLTTGPSLFKQGGTSDKSLDGFDKVVKQLLSSLSIPCLSLQSFRAMGKSARSMSYALPHDTDPVEIRDLVEIADGKVRRIPKFDTLIESDQTGKTLHLVLPEPLSQDVTLVAISDRPLHLAGPLRDADLKPLQSWLQRQKPPVQRFMINALNNLREDDSLAENLYQEVRCPEHDKPRLDVLYAARCGDGLLYMIKARDPRGLLSNARWVSDGIEIDVPLDRPVWHPRHGDVYPGYVRGFAPADPLARQFHLWGELRSRRAFLTETVEPEAFDGLVPEIFEELDDALLDRMLGQAVALALEDRPSPKSTIDWFGKRPAKAKTSLLIFIQDTFDYPRALLTQLALEPGGDASVTLLVAAHPDQRPGLRRLAEDLNAVTSCTIAVLCLGARALPSEKLRAALISVNAEATFLFNGACLPENKGWLDRWYALVSTVSTAQTACIPVDGTTFSDRPPGRCQIFNHSAVNFLAQRPLRSASLEADLNDLSGIKTVAVTKTDGALCYDPSPEMSKIQGRADIGAVAYMAQRAV